MIRVVDQQPPRENGQCALLTDSSARIAASVPTGSVRLAPHQRAMVRRCLEIERSIVTSGGDGGRAVAAMADAPGTGKTFVALALSIVAPPGTGDTVVVVPEHIYKQWTEATAAAGMVDSVVLVNSYKAMMALMDSAAAAAESNDGSDSAAPDSVTILTTRLYVPLLSAYYERRQRRGPFRVILDEPTEATRTDDAAFFSQATVVWLISASAKAAHMVQCEDAFVRRSFAEAFEWSAYRSAEVTFVRCRNVLTTRVLTRLFHGPKLDAYFACDFGTFDKGARVQSAADLIKLLRADLVERIADVERTLSDVKNRRRRATADEIARLTDSVTAMRGSLKRMLSTLVVAGVCTRCVRPIVDTTAFRPECSEMDLYCESCSMRSCACGSDQCGLSRYQELPVYTADDCTRNNDKAAVLCRLIAAAPADAKIVVASSYARSLEVVREHEGFPPSADVAETPDEFASTDKRVFLLDASLHSRGANLHATTDMVFMHKFEPELERQVLGRALRPPRKTKLRLWHLRYDAEHVVLIGGGSAP